MRSSISKLPITTRATRSSSRRYPVSSGRAGISSNTDLRARDDVEAWEADVANCPMTVLSQRVINREVARGLEINTPRLQKLNARFVPGPLSNLTFSKVCQNLLDEDSSYRMYCMQA